VNVRVSAAESGLPRDTVFPWFHFRALDPSRLLIPEAGTLPPPRMPEVDKALRRTLAL
jgi:mRNA interferase MazF